MKIKKDDRIVINGKIETVSWVNGIYVYSVDRKGHERKAVIDLVQYYYELGDEVTWKWGDYTGNGIVINNDKKKIVVWAGESINIINVHELTLISRRK